MSMTEAVAAPLFAETPHDQACFFGYHDVTPWGPRDVRLVLHRVDPALRALPAGAPAEICVWDPNTNEEPRSIGTTTAWNFQMGARAQWLPDGRIAYNVVRDGSLRAVLRDPDAAEENELPFAIAAIDPSGRESLSPHFGRLDRYWPSYGVPGADAPSAGEPVPRDDGLWRLNLESGRPPELWMSVATVAAHGALSVPRDIAQFLTHPLYSPSGRRVAFLHRFLTADGSTYTRLMVAERDGSGLRALAEEKVSHFCWRDDDTILVWCRQMAGALAAARRHGWLATPLLRPVLRLARRMRGSVKQALMYEHYFLVPVDEPGGRTVVGTETLPVDGHPMFRPEGGDARRWIVTDTYPDQEGIQTLILYDMAAGKRFDIGRFGTDPSLGHGDIKCDLHPRWNRAGTRVAVDTTRNRIRQVAVYDVAGIMKASA